jgi:hypothetical protein
VNAGIELPPSLREHQAQNNCCGTQACADEETNAETMRPVAHMGLAVSVEVIVPAHQPICYCKTAHDEHSCEKGIVRCKMLKPKQL